MLEICKHQLSPYQVFDPSAWSGLRADTPLTLNESDLERLQSLNDPIDLEEVSRIYLPLSRLLSFYVEATQGVHRATLNFLGSAHEKVPFIIGISGSVAVGKSTTARVLKALLSRWPSSPKVELLPTDGFLYPNAYLEQNNLLNRKGFPESYNRKQLLRFLSDIKAGKSVLQAPVYSHFYYDVVSGSFTDIAKPDILIIEGLNILQTSRPPKDGKSIPFVSDFIDFKIYMDADEQTLETWYVERFMKLRQTAFQDKKSYFYRYSQVNEEEAFNIALQLWRTINLVNLSQNILPTRPRADLILRKGDEHKVTSVLLRKL